MNLQKIPTKPLIITIHLSIWVFLVLLGTYFFSDFWSLKTAFFRSVLNVILFGILFYGNAFFLIPRYFNHQKYFAYTISSVCLMAILFFIRIILKEYIYGPVTKNPTAQPYVVYFFILVTLVFIWFVSTLYKLIEQHFHAQEQKQRMLQKTTEAELSLLKAQVNPHFLFNTLNNLYSLSYRGDPRTPDGLISLSKLMRYMLQETGSEKVLLAKEVEYLEEFIRLQRLRIEGDPVISFIYPKPLPVFLIAPLILIPFVENCFKHGNVSGIAGGWIKIELLLDEQTMVFRCQNSISTQKLSESLTSGTGLKNVRQRLDILYHGTYSLEIIQREGVFSVILKIGVA